MDDSDSSSGTENLSTPSPQPRPPMAHCRPSEVINDRADSTAEDEIFGDVLAEQFSANLGEQRRNAQIPCRTSTLRGWMYEKELLHGSNVRFLEVLKLEKGAFFHVMRHLGPMLEASAHITLNEQVMIFLFTVGHAISFRHAAERWQHSTETIHRYFHIVRSAFEELAPSIIVQPGPGSPVPHTILKSAKFNPWFESCLGAIDGTHVQAHVTEADRPKHRNRKGTLSQNVLAGCDFDMKFNFIYCGIGGSANDQYVLNKARENGHFLVPKGRFYLGDAGYAHRPDVFTPLRGVRYHLQEWASGNRAPRTADELYNLRHSNLRNVIERIFGVMKLRTKAMEHMPAIALDHQFSLVVACAVLHNLIRDAGPEDAIYAEYDRNVAAVVATRTRDVRWADNYDANEEGNPLGSLPAAQATRARIAEDMFADYLAHPRRSWR